MNLLAAPFADWLALAGVGRWWWHVPSGWSRYDGLWCAQLGLPAVDLDATVRLWEERLHPEDAQDARDALAPCLRVGGRNDYEATFRMRAAGDRWHWIWSRGRVLTRLRDGSPEWMVGIHQVVDKTMQAPHALQQDERWIDVFDTLASGFRYVTSYDAGGEQPLVEYASPLALGLLGIEGTYDPAEVGTRLRAQMPPQDRQRVIDAVRDAHARRATRVHVTYRLQPANAPAGVWRHFRALSVGEYLPSGRSRWVGYALDITDEVERRELERIAKLDLQATLDAISDLWFELDEQLVYTRVNASDPALLLQPAEQLIGRRLHDVLPPTTLDRFLVGIEEARVHHSSQPVRYTLDINGRTRHFDARIAAKREDGRVDGFIGVVCDTTAQEEMLAQREWLATHDEATGLSNRRGAAVAAHQWWERMRASEAEDAGTAWVVAALLDIDGLRTINYSLGHRWGDALIAGITRRLREALPTAFCARIGSDEFLVLHALPHQDGAQRLLHDLQRYLTRPISLGDVAYPPSVTAGWTLLQGNQMPSVSMTNVITWVEEALYAAKRRGAGSIERFEPARFELGVKRHRMAQSLGCAAESRELQLVYQPIVNANGHLLGCEALMRWHSSEFGDVSPAEFIPIAEKTRRILDLGAWALRTACEQAARATVPDAPYVSVNISTEQLLHADFELCITEALLASGLPAPRLQLEITESALAEDLEAARATMERIAALGVRWALDDFGTGYSNLLELKRLPLSVLKIDRSFVRDIERDEDNRQIVTAVLELARRLEITVTAEGVETDAQWQWLRRHGCHSLQGYRFGKPGAWPG